MPHHRPPGKGLKRPLLQLAVGVLAFVFAPGGCGSPEMGRVAGRITNGGKPVVGVMVVFYTPNRPVARAMTDADGRYTLSTRRLGDGAYAGFHKVSIDPMAGSGDGSRQHLGGSVVPNVYDLATTPLEAEVVAGKSNTCDLDIATAKVSGPK